MEMDESVRRRFVTEAVHSCLMEGADVSDEFVGDATRYMAGELTVVELTARARERNTHASHAVSSSGECVGRSPDPYLDARTGILVNVVGAQTRRELALAEGELGTCAIVTIYENPPVIKEGNLREWCDLHRRLFTDVYPWAGHTRTVDIAKADGLPFLPCSMIPQAAAWASGELMADKLFQNVSPSHFAERFAYHYDTYNYIHPFREGNGRAQRLLWSLVCHQAGYDIDWRRVSKEDNDEASRVAAERGDRTLLERMIAPAVTCRGKPLP